jgi:SAM-dependent methyltransferase
MTTRQAHLLKTGERMIPSAYQSQEEYLMYLRHVVAYQAVRPYLTPDTVLLDLGCGEGYGVRALATDVRMAVGVEVDATSVAYAARTYGADGCVFGRYDGTVLPFPDAVFHVVVSFQVMEHVLDDAQFVAEVYRVLRPSGVFLATTPDRRYRLSPGQKPWNRFHIREYAPDDLRAVLATQFSQVQVSSICGDDTVYAIEAQRVQWARRVARWDLLHLRERVPESWLPRIGGTLKRLTRRGGAHVQSRPGLADSVARYSTDNFSLCATSSATSLDLLGICHKS